MEYFRPVGLQNAEQAAAVSNNVVTIPERQSQVNQAGAVISKIEAIFESMLDNLDSGGGSISIPYRSRTARGAAARGDGVVSFPGRTRAETNKFVSLLRILEISRKAIATGSVVTKRNIYYQNTDLFKHQRTVDSLVDDLACTLGVGRDDLNIVAAAKGLFAGPITLKMRNNSVIPCGLSHERGTLIPTPKLIHKIGFGQIEWVLVIEKEATFRTLAAAGYHTRSMAGHGILVTGKGFPDLATRSFLNLLHSARPHLPMYALVDYDPDGLSIFRTYQRGSASLLHEEDTVVPQLQWLGLRSDQILPSTRSPEDFASSQSSQETAGSSSQGSRSFSSQESIALSASGSSVPARRRGRQPQHATPESLSKLTSRDRKMAVSMLKGLCVREDVDAEEEMSQVRELQMMLMLNIKAEIQAVDNLGDITHWLDEKLYGFGM
ncbi:Spo11/DNA topoisomerase VI subunit A [Coniochaeta sp. 2T2.1]|nr:Spo11/DNA topoisomerase VI subunit A [Coniochaeta sp. 2T2.1]